MLALKAERDSYVSMSERQFGSRADTFFHQTFHDRSSSAYIWPGMMLIQLHLDRLFRLRLPILEVLRRPRVEFA